MHKIFLILALFIFSCDEELLDCAYVPGGSAYLDRCNECVGGSTSLEPCEQDCFGEWGGYAEYDECGVCGGPGIETPEFNSIYDEGEGCDCNGNSWDCLGICGGNNNNNGMQYTDCDGTCISESFRDYFQDGDCDNYSWADFACEEKNCDGGDCGVWNGTGCYRQNRAAIKYDYYNDCCPYNISSEDPSIPNYFYWNQYYEATTGTYYFSYVGDQISTDEYFYGYYTTFTNSNGYNLDLDNECFELVMYNYIGPSFYNWSSYCSSYYFEQVEACNDFFNLNCSDYNSRPSQRSIYLDSLTNIQYQKHLEAESIEKSIEKDLVQIHGSGESHNIKSEIVIKIDSPETDHRIIEIDSDPNVVVQEGKNYIMKYIRKRIDH